MGKSPDVPKFRPEPMRLSREGRILLEQLREEYIPRYAFYREQGYIPIGMVSQRDPHILQKGRIVDVQNARSHATELLLPVLQERYRRRGKEVKIIGEKGAVRLRRGKQADANSPKHFGVDPNGVTFYISVEQAVSLDSAREVTHPDIPIYSTSEPVATVPRAFLCAPS